MAKKKKEIPSLLNKEQEKKLQDMVNSMLDLAANVVVEYKEDIDFEDLHALSGSVIQIHETSPFLNEIFEGNSWKKVMTNLPPILKDTKEEDASE